MMTTRSQVCETSGRMWVLRMMVCEPARPLMRSRVQAGGRFVQDQDFGVVQDRLSQSDTLLVALRELAAEAGRDVGDARLLHRRVDLRPQRLGSHAADPADEQQVVADGHVRVERRRFRQVADAALGLERLIEDVEPGNDGLAGGGRHVARQDAHGRGLAGPVGAEEAEDLALVDAERDVVDRGDAAVLLGEVLNLDHR
jgi:hypothetical protein